MGRRRQAAAPALKPGAILTDVGSVKGAVAEAMVAAAPDGVFVVPGHPIAGTEHSGPDAGLRRAVPRPLDHPDARAPPRTPAYAAAVERLTGLLEALGAGSRPWTSATTTWCWPSPATCPT